MSDGNGSTMDGLREVESADARKALLTETVAPWPVN